MGRRSAAQKSWVPVPLINCEFCEKQFQRAGPHEAHVKTKHADILQKRAEEEARAERERLLADYDLEHPVTLSSQFTIARIETATIARTTQRFPAYLAPFVEDLDEADDGCDSTLDENDAPGCNPTTPARLDIEHENGGHVLRTNDQALEPPWLHEANLFAPFAGPKDFVLGQYFVKHEIPQTAINEYFNAGLGKTPTNTKKEEAGRESITFSSWHTLSSKIDSVEKSTSTADLTWKKGTVAYGNLSRNRGRPVDYYCRDLVQCIQYIAEQPYLEPSMVYKAVKRFDRRGDREFSELCTGDWWWRAQV